jgi:hypothetical protein
MNIRTEIVNVRGTGPYVARCAGKTASSTMSADSAAQKAAAKAAEFPLDHTGSVILPDSAKPIKLKEVTRGLGFATFLASWDEKP